MKKNVLLTWEDVFSRIEYIKKKYKIDRKTKIYGVPKNGMILAGFFNANNVSAPEDADFILDDILDSGTTKRRFKKMFPKKKFITLLEKDSKVDWVNFPFEKQINEDQNDTVIRLLQIIGA